MKNYKQSLVKYLEKINSIIFPPIFFVAFIVSLLESYFYIGFLQNHLIVPSPLIYFLSLINFIVLAKSKASLSEIYEKRTVRVLLSIGPILFLILILLYVVLNEMEVSHYGNFIFAYYHIWPGGLIITTALLFEISFLFVDMKRNDKVRV